MQSGASESVSGVSIKRPPMVCTVLLSNHLHYCVEAVQAVNTLIKRKEKVDVNLLRKCNTRFFFHLHLSHDSLSS